MSALNKRVGCCLSSTRGLGAVCPDIGVLSTSVIILSFHSVRPVQCAQEVETHRIECVFFLMLIQMVHCPGISPDSNCIAIVIIFEYLLILIKQTLEKVIEKEYTIF